MSKLSSAQRRYLLVGQSLVPGVLNFVFNGLIGWLAFRGVNPVPIWQPGSPGIAFDSLATCTPLPALTCLAVTPSVRRHVRIGKVKPAALPSWLRSLQRPLLFRATLLGLGGLSLGGMVIACTVVAGFTSFALTSFLWFKASYTALLGACITPIIRSWPWPKPRQLCQGPKLKPVDSRRFLHSTFQTRLLRCAGQHTEEELNRGGLGYREGDRPQTTESVCSQPSIGR